MVNENIQKLKELVQCSDNIVFFGGAGVSTESGIPDFRSVDGLYNQTYAFPPETILSHSFFEKNPEEYYRFHRDKLNIAGAGPNAAHRRLAELEADGSKTVLELHGSLLRAYCARCGKSVSAERMNVPEGVPRCDCGGIIRPDIVLYEEALDDDTVSRAVHFIRNADMLIIGGTSLAVYPAAGLINYYRGHKLVLINRTETAADSMADLIIRDKIGEVFSQI